MPDDRVRCQIELDRGLRDAVLAESKVAGVSFVAEVRSALRLWLLFRSGEVEVLRDGVKLEVM